MRGGALLATLVLLGASAPASAQTLTWPVVPSPDEGAYNNILFGVSCVSPTRCTATGVYSTTSGGTGRTLVESWDGTRWSVVPSPSPTAGSGVLQGVSCVSAIACTASGVHITSGGHDRTLIESWNGTRWSVVPSPGRGSDSYLEGVSCTSATACTATGRYSRGGTDGPEKTLVESWDGTSWSVIPSPNRGNSSYLDGVSCTSATACTAAGYYLSNSRIYGRTLIESATASR